METFSNSADVIDTPKVIQTHGERVRMLRECTQQFVTETLRKMNGREPDRKTVVHVADDIAQQIMAVKGWRA